MFFREVKLHIAAKSRNLTHSAPPSVTELKIRILATSDLHMNLNGFDYHSDAPEPTIGFTRTATLIRDARAEAEEEGALVLLFDNGDSLQGTPIGEWAVERSNAPHILMRAFGNLGYDAIGLGNHDFDFGLEVLDHILADSPCPVVCSNVHRQDADPLWQSRAILTRPVRSHDQQVSLKIGIFSVLPPQTVQWEAHRLQNKVIIDDILTCAGRMVQDLQAENCDLIIALAHTGLGSPNAEPEMENAIIPMAAIDGIDALIAGHSHLTLPGPAHEGLDHVEATLGKVHGKPVVMPGAAGSNLGLIDLKLQKANDGKWTIQDQSTELRSVCPTRLDGTAEPVSENPDLFNLFSKCHSETRNRTAQPVGRTNQHLHSYFSFCAPDRGLVLAAAAQAAALRLYLQGTPMAELPLLSAVAPSKFGGRAGPRFFTDVPPGQVFLRHISDLYIFPNELQAVVVDGTQIGDWLEMSAGVFNQLKPDCEIDLVDPSRAGHNFDVLQGLSYQIDLSQPARFDAAGHVTNPAHRRIRDIRFEGYPVVSDQRFVVALNNYRANGGGHFPFIDRAKPIPLPARPIQQILQDYVSGILPRDPLENAPHPFHFAPLPGATALLRTGSKARDHLAELEEYNPQLVGEDDKGFLLIRLAL
ncbi:bifunctional 2',3'-cyclic-nucleotide 2'-phosphodiesterase/3'-nucleotidase [Ruegeria arenilitoris]|uniref:bifunctional 2',3'-cyclic-nucleotide 2'-phosphodiesterase/3'-nucleotidase n=1 Tax=Ruegeria arenilitoris TaxID=1173585 RepID=UPI00147F64CC|nr:bifunctional 2',3'-cyclic-nucleotide 2'-phosphodiesterase/3'-nucleotidase [Ruegeria arenilitoris]